MRKRILDQPIDIATFDEAIYLAKTAIINSRQFKIITLNPEMVVNAVKNFEFQAAINNANFIVPDGTGIIWALKLNGCKNIQRIPGIELSEKILAITNESSKKIALFGSTKEVLEKVTKAINEKHPNISIVKTIDGFHGIEKDLDIATEIAKERPDVVFVALGTPRQEIWINKYSYLFPQSLMIGVGGSLDIWAGKKHRAPLWMRKNNLEWFYRVITEPKRTIRILKTLPIYVFMTLKAKITGYLNLNSK